MFSPKQQALVTKAVKEGYLDHRLSENARTLLAAFVPSNYIQASHIVSLVMAAAYGRGNGLGDMWDPMKREKAQQACADELSVILFTEK